MSSFAVPFFTTVFMLFTIAKQGANPQAQTANGISIVSPANGSEMPERSKIQISAAVQGSQPQAVELYWQQTNRFLLCPGGNGTDWSCSAGTHGYVWSLDVGKGDRTFYARARYGNGGTVVTPTYTIHLRRPPEIAFVSDKDGQLHIFGVDRDGTNERQLLQDAASSPAWSPDGSQLLFVSERDGKPSLFIWTLASGEIKQVTDLVSRNSFASWRGLSGNSPTQPLPPGCNPGPPTARREDFENGHPIGRPAIAYDKASIDRLIAAKVVEQRSHPTGNETVDDGGGPVLCSAQVFVILWKGWSSEEEQRFTTAVNAIAGSDFVKQLSMYRTNIGPATISGVANLGNSNGGSSPESALINWIDSGSVPAPISDQNLYLIVVPARSQITLESIPPLRHRGVVGYHWYRNHNNWTIHYGVILNGSTETFGHELIEAITDPRGTAIRFNGCALTDGQDRVCEVADPCESEPGYRLNGSGPYVQPWLSTSEHGCISPGTIRDESRSW